MQERLRTLQYLAGKADGLFGVRTENAVKEYLPKLKKNHIISDYVFGENWGDLNESKQLITSICPEGIVHENLQGLNSGVSVVLI